MAQYWCMYFFRCLCYSLPIPALPRLCLVTEIGQWFLLIFSIVNQNNILCYSLMLISNPWQQLGKIYAVLDRSFCGRKHCNTLHLKACRCHWMGRSHHGALILLDFCTGDSVCSTNEQRWRVQWFLKFPTFSVTFAFGSVQSCQFGAHFLNNYNFCNKFWRVYICSLVFSMSGYMLCKCKFFFKCLHLWWMEGSSTLQFYCVRIYRKERVFLVRWILQFDFVLAMLKVR